MAVKVEDFTSLLTDLVTLKIQYGQLLEVVKCLQSEITMLKSLNKSRNISPEEEKSAELKSRVHGRKSHEEALREIGSGLRRGDNTT